MRRALRITSLLLLVLLAGCDKAEHWAYRAAMSEEKARAGLDDHLLATKDGITWHYLESEDTDGKPVVLLVHGFGADSSNWIRFANELQGEFHFIIPDLPGHGQTTRTTDMDYHIETQARRLFRFMDALKVNRFHVVGNSMGGGIALKMAMDSPQRLRSLGLVDAAGVTIVSNAYDKLLQSGSNPLIPHKPDDFFTTLDWATADPPWTPDFIIRVMGEKKAANAPVAEKVWHDINAPGELEMKDRLSQIRTPTLIVWGAKDRLLPEKNADVFDKLIPDSRKVVISGVGHVPMVEAPGKTSVPFRAFWNERHSGDETHTF